MLRQEIKEKSRRRGKLCTCVTKLIEMHFKILLAIGWMKKLFLQINCCTNITNSIQNKILLLTYCIARNQYGGGTSSNVFMFSLPVSNVITFESIGRGISIRFVLKIWSRSIFLCYFCVCFFFLFSALVPLHYACNFM